MNLSNQDKWILILGASSGIGLATAQKFAGEGFNLALIYRENMVGQRKFEASLHEFVYTNSISCIHQNTNALQVEHRNDFIDKLKVEMQPGKIKLMLHSIAKGNLNPLVSGDSTAKILSEEDFLLTNQAMSLSLLEWSRAILAAGLFHQQASIIGLTSEAASRYCESYAAVAYAKSSLKSLIEYMAVEFAPFGIRSNLVQAGVTDTPSFRKIKNAEKLYAQTIKRNPFKRATTPNDVANVVYLLALNEAAWINGSVIVADGGEHLC